MSWVKNQVKNAGEKSLIPEIRVTMNPGELLIRMGNQKMNLDCVAKFVHDLLLLFVIIVAYIFASASPTGRGVGESSTDARPFKIA